MSMNINILGDCLGKRLSKLLMVLAYSQEEAKGQFHKRAVLANALSFRFSFRENMRMYPRSGFRSREHPPKPPFCTTPERWHVCRAHFGHISKIAPKFKAWTVGRKTSIVSKKGASKQICTNLHPHALFLWAPNRNTAAQIRTPSWKRPQRSAYSRRGVQIRFGLELAEFVERTLERQRKTRTRRLKNYQYQYWKAKT